ncbi:uncharacterized protein LOC104440848 [Eucalyptus grandis]|uniref:uncharacterized protein LOC104440848 n=1 Tax=Eucalyptus grandis TaxID=71139 RepID=UPI000525E23D|nr:uncharacterized protein LOC104440848 [Eucalyptus grandis]
MSMPAPNLAPAEPFCTLRSEHTQDSHPHRLITIEALLVLLACSLTFLGVFGAFRRCCTNRAFIMFGFAAYTISFTAVAYTLGLIQNATFCSQLFPLGAVFLVMVLGSADSYTVHSLEDVERWRSFNIEMLGKCFMIGRVISIYRPTSKIMQISYNLIFLVSTKIDYRVRALMSASKDVMQKNCILLADYMKTEHQKSDSNQVDPSSLRGYKYFVRETQETKDRLWFLPAYWRRRPLFFEGKAPEYRISLGDTDDVITVEKVWNCSGRLLSARDGDPDGKLKDLCLSFSLFKLIRLRFAGYSLPQEAHDKLWSLIHHSLHSEANGYQRVFRVIEVELAFLFDLFYTNFSVTPSPHHIIVEVLQLAILLTFFLTIISTYQKSQNESTWFTDEALVTFLMMIAMLGIEIVQFGIRVFSEWAKVLYICIYVRNEWCQRNRIAEKVIEIMCGIKLRKPWGGQLRQFSLLEKCSYRPPKLIYNSFTAAYFDQVRDGQQEIAPTKLSKEVMKAIARSLMNNGTRNLENGRASLRRNNVFDQLSWACNLESSTHVIMVWHIATSIYEHERRGAVPSFVSQGQRENFHIATTLSKYLAYLVAFAPRLLPNHPYRSEYIFGHVVKEARELFEGSSMSMDKRIQKLKDLGNEQYVETIVGQGAWLRRQLSIEATDDEHIWTILADFWAEMMLYVAPSTDVGAHAKYLSTGGEFVTHVWVLLSHAGIMRSPDGSEQHDDPERY